MKWHLASKPKTVRRIMLYDESGLPKFVSELILCECVCLCVTIKHSDLLYLKETLALTKKEHFCSIVQFDGRQTLKAMTSREQACSPHMATKSIDISTWQCVFCQRPCTNAHMPQCMRRRYYFRMMVLLLLFIVTIYWIRIKINQNYPGMHKTKSETTSEWMRRRTLCDDYDDIDDACLYL